MTALSEPSARTAVSCCHMGMQKCANSAHQTPGDLFMRPHTHKQNKLSSQEPSNYNYCLRSSESSRCPQKDSFHPWRAMPLAKRLRNTKKVFKRRNSGQMLALSQYNTDAPRKQRFAPPWAVQSYSLGCFSPRSWKTAMSSLPQSPVCHARSSIPTSKRNTGTRQ